MNLEITGRSDSMSERMERGGSGCIGDNMHDVTHLYGHTQLKLELQSLNLSLISLGPFAIKDVNNRPGRSRCGRRYMLNMTFLIRMYMFASRCREPDSLPQTAATAATIWLDLDEVRKSD